MLLQLRNIYTALYKDIYQGNPLFTSKKETCRPDLSEFEYFTHPATIRWALPALAGKVKIHIHSEEQLNLLFDHLPSILSVKNQKDFLKLHFMPVYDDLKPEFDYGSEENNKTNLQDLMGRRSGSFKGSGRTIRHKMINCFRDAEMIQKMVTTQQAILEQYDYRPDHFRSCIMNCIEQAIHGDAEDSQNTVDHVLLESRLLQQLRVVMLNLLSNGSDAAALACLLLCAALREDSAGILFHFTGCSNYDLLRFEKPTNTGRIDLGDELYVTYLETPNYSGVSRKADMTLWKYPNILINKITDIWGYFFYPVPIIDVEGFRHGYRVAGPQIEFSSHIFPFKNNLALFEWTYQPDGRYFSDEDGFGAENCEEIILYAYMDKEGKFITPFSNTYPASDKTTK